MALTLFNTLTKKKEKFTFPSGREILYYTCGPTVHDYAHIGNFRTFVVQDILKRWLLASGLHVKQVMNITDVDEKTIERAARKKISLASLTEKYEKAFFEDLDCLNIKRADHYPRVSENMDAIAAMVAGLDEKDHVIRDEVGSYYFDINTFQGYGMLSGKMPSRRIRALMPREDYTAPKNFLLWKRCETDHGIKCFESQLGRGLPGWHIECTALANRYLGPSIDIHSGGADLVFPHHENEIAEAEAYSGQRFSRFWVHVEHLEVFGKKMSKSLGNFFTLRQIIKKGYDPRAMKLLYLQTHYRSKLNFDFKELEKAQQEIVFLDEVLKDLNDTKNFGDDSCDIDIKLFQKEFSDQMDDDLQTGSALRLFFDFLRDVNGLLEDGQLTKTAVNNIGDTIDWFDNVFGLLEGCESTQ
jgi:cysteinyl-tRNA synthetase